MGIVINNSSIDKMQDFLNKVQNPKKLNNEATYNHCIKADALRIKNYYWESIDEYLLSISYDNYNYEAHKGLGLSYKQVGFIKSAIEAFKKAKKLAPFDKTIYYELGCCYSMDNKYAKALDEFRRAIKLDPNYIDAQFNLAIAHEFNNEYELALKIYSKILYERPSYIAAYNNLGSLYMKLGMFSQSISTFKDLLKINPDYSRAYLGLAVTFDKMDSRNDAIRYYKKYIEIKPNSTNVTYILERIRELKAESKLNKRSHLKLVSKMSHA